MANTASRTESGPTEVQFFKRICSSTFHRIKFPAEFYKTYVEGKHIDEFITLKSPRLSRPWKVTRVGDSLTDGWSGFVKLHNLNRGDYVHFSHEGDFFFYVTPFSEDGDRILYRKNETSPVSTRTGQKRKPVHGTNEAGKVMRTKDKAGVVIKEAGSSSNAKKKTKKGITKQSAVNDSFVKIVTDANLKSNSVYIPKKFTKENGLEDKDLSFLGLLDSTHNLWGCEVALCTDDRLKITKGWAAFCRDNNLQIGDCCEFKLQPDYEEIMLELVGVPKDGKKPVGRIDQSSDVLKEDEYELEEVDGPSNDDDVEMISMDTFFKYSAGRTKMERGQPSRK